MNMAQDAQFDAPGVQHLARSGDAPTSLRLSLDACRRLSQASGVFLLCVNQENGAVDLVETDEQPTSTVAAAPMLAATRQNVDALSVATKPDWLTLRGGGAMLVARVWEGDGVSYFMALMLEPGSPTSRAGIARAMPELVTLVAAQLAAGRRVDEIRQQHDAVAQALDHDDCGVIALRADHSMVFGNVAAHATLAEGQGLQIKRGTVRPSDYRHVMKFEAALDAIRVGATSHQEKSSALVMLLPAGPGLRPLVVVIAPGQSPMYGSDVNAPDVHALIYMFRPTQSAGQGLEALAQLHALSRVETRLLAQLCSGRTVGEAAQMMRIKLETARAYLKQIFAKTGTHRQGELVMLMTHNLRAMRGDFAFVAA